MNHLIRQRAEAGRAASGSSWAERLWLHRRLDRSTPKAGASGLDFDALARDLAQGVSRRQILHRIAGALAVGFTAELFGRLALDPAPAAAAPAPTPCSSSSASTCLDQAQASFAGTLAACLPGTTDQASVAFYLALAQCFDRAEIKYTLDEGQCVGAEAGCPAGSECSGDLCCPAGTAGCGAVCCAAGQSCVNGQCGGMGTGGGTGSGTTTTPTSCPAGQSLCGNACVNLQSDTMNCGSCGHVCPSGQNCGSGQCMLTCAAGLTVCGGTCVNLQSDPKNCGGCGKACGNGLLCLQGSCKQQCPTGLTACGGTCVNLGTDPNNCGSCGRVCGSGVCGGGNCAAARLTGPCALCGSACTNLQNDPRNCGACGTTCGRIPGVSEVCLGGTCQAPQATTGQGGGTGPKVNCQQCLIACGFSGCGYACTDVQSDRYNCGQCGNNCPAGATCSNGTCVCAAGLTLCDGTCMDLQSDPKNCGACGLACNVGCSTVDLLGCVGGQCHCGNNLTFCADAGYCNIGFGSFPTGACVDLQSNNGNCGACGHACGSNTHCVAGQCVCSSQGLTLCTVCSPANPTFCQQECFDVKTDSQNCGACGHVCPSGQSCSGGVCVCPSGQTYCPGAGCVDLNTSFANCGACGHACGRIPIGTVVCVGGKCEAPVAHM